MITIENVDKAINQMKIYGTQIVLTISNQIQIYGDRIVNELQIDYPDLTITGQFFPENMEYWISIQRLGEELTWIKCPVSNLFFERERDEYGEQKFYSHPEFELDIDELVKRIADELSLQINQVVGRKV